jgi:hypothetical protein
MPKEKAKERHNKIQNNKDKWYHEVENNHEKNK